MNQDFDSDDECYTENQLNAQKTIYVQYPNSTKIKNRLAQKKTIVGKQLNSIKQAGNIPFAELENVEENIDFLRKRHKLFSEYWSRCEKKIDSILHNHNLPLFITIIDHINESFKVKTRKSFEASNLQSENYNDLSTYFSAIDTRFENKLLTILLLSGTSPANHLSFFSGITERTNKLHKNIKLITLDSRSCTDITSTLKLIAFGLYDYSNDDLSKIPLNFDLINDFCFNYYEKESERTGTEVGISNTELRIVCLIKNINTFKQEILLRLLRIMQKNSHIVPFKLILNAASFSTRFLESSISSSIRDIITCKIIKNNYDSGTLIEQITESLFFSLDNIKSEGAKTSGPQIILPGPTVTASLLNRHKDNMSTIESFVSGIKYSIMMHFFSLPISVLTDYDNAENTNIFKKALKLGNEDSQNELDPEWKGVIDSNGGKHYLEFIRHVPSFQKFIRLLLQHSSRFSLKNFKGLLDYLIDYHDKFASSQTLIAENLSFFLSSLVPFAFHNFKLNLQNFLHFLELLQIIQKAIIENKRFCYARNILNNSITKFIRVSKIELYSIILNKERSRHTDELFRLRNEKQYLKFVKNLLAAIVSMYPHFFVKMITDITQFISKLSCETDCSSSTHDFFLSIKKRNILESTTEFSSEDNGQYYSEIFFEGANKNDGLKNIPVQGKIKFEQLVESFKDALKKTFFHDELISMPFKLSSSARPTEVGSVGESDKENSIVTDFDFLVKLITVDKNFHKFSESLLSEVFIAESSILPSVLFPPIRRNLEYALANPTDYLLAQNVKLHVKDDGDSLPLSGSHSDLNLVESDNESLKETSSDTDIGNSSLEVEEPKRKRKKTEKTSGKADDSGKKNSRNGKISKKAAKSIDIGNSLEEEEANLMDGFNTNDDLINQTLMNLRKLNDPLVCEMYKLCREAPININIYDYFQSLKSTLSKKDYLKLFLKALTNAQSDLVTKDSRVLDEIYHHFLPYEQLKGRSPKSEEFKALKQEVDANWNLIVLSFFYEFLADLSYMGVIKDNKRKIEAVEKAVWKSL